MKQVLYTILTILAALVGGDQNEEDLKTVIVGDPTTYRSNYEQVSL